MTRGLQFLKASSAILVMVLATASLISYSFESSLYNYVNPHEDSRNMEARHTGLIYRMLMLKSRHRDDNVFPANWHFYFKPRRKDGLSVDVRGTTNVFAENNDTPRLPLFLSNRTSNHRHNSSTSSPPSRRKRSPYNYTGLFGRTGFSRESQNMEDLRKTHTGFKKLYHKSTSTLLQITPSGKITGVAQFNSYCLVVIKGVDHVDNMTMVKIYGNATNLFIAMNKRGILYTTTNADHTDTNFLHEYDRNSYDAYLSNNHRRYIAMKGSQGKSSPVRGKRLSKASNRALFLRLGVRDSDLDALAKTAEQKSAHTTSLAPAKPFGHEVSSTGIDTVGDSSQSSNEESSVTTYEVEKPIITSITPMDHSAKPTGSVPTKAKSRCGKTRRNGKRKKKRKCKEKHINRKRRRRRKQGGKRKTRQRAKHRRTRSLKEGNISSDIAAFHYALTNLFLSDVGNPGIPSHTGEVT